MRKEDFLKVLKTVSYTETEKPGMMKDRSVSSSSAMMPVLFVGHGSPMNAIEDNEFVKGWEQSVHGIPRPRAILCISAHWETSGTFVTAVPEPPTIHDFGGFPRKLYEIQYPAPGDPALARKIQQLITATTTMADEKWGLDHGSWSVLTRMYPDAEIPVIQLSLDYTKPASFHYDLGRQLMPLRREGILIIGSGNIVHNLMLVDWNNLDRTGYGYDWALEASQMTRQLINAKNHRSLIDYKSLGKAFGLAVPTPEHFLPLLYILALQQEGEEALFFNDKTVAGSLDMTSLKIG